VSAALFPKKVLQIPQVALPVNELANALSSLIKTARFILHAANEPRTMLNHVFEGKIFGGFKLRRAGSRGRLQMLSVGLIV
jgi:hypothetical protein